MSRLELTPEAHAMLADYPVLVSIPVQWGDQDALGHVNNTVAIRWFETGRVAMLEAANLTHLMEGKGLGPILAAIHCNYRRQIRFPDIVHIGTRIGKIGRTSFIMEHAIYSEANHAIAVDGESTIVLFDYANQRPVRITPETLPNIAAFRTHE
jgi:acyl-CoA thioester hydrolase